MTLPDRYLLPREVEVASVRQHPALLLQPLTVALGGVLVALAVTNMSHRPAVVEWVVWILAGLLVVRFILAAASWTIRYMVITEQRLMLISGLFNRSLKVVPNANLMEMRYERSFAGRLMGFGTFVVEAGAVPQIIIDYIPYSEQLQLVLSGGLYGKPHDSDAEPYPEIPELELDDLTGPEPGSADGLGDL